MVCHCLQLEIGGWERLCQARNQQLEDVNKEKGQLEEQIRKKLEELEQDSTLQDSTLPVHVWHMGVGELHGIYT